MALSVSGVRALSERCAERSSTAMCRVFSLPGVFSSECMSYLTLAWRMSSELMRRLSFEGFLRSLLAAKASMRN